MIFKSPWLALAVASGACAAFNSVFAKLTTTSITSSWSSAISTTLGLAPSKKPVELLIRTICFLLNLAFNASMWALFTAALTRATSTTRVAIINTSANFVLTALLGLAVFGERLPPLWWVGAGGLVVGTVVIGRREEDKVGGDAGLTLGVGEGENGSKDGEGERGDECKDGEGEGEQDGGISDGVEIGGREVEKEISDEGGEGK